MSRRNKTARAARCAEHAAPLIPVGAQTHAVCALEHIYSHVVDHQVARVRPGAPYVLEFDDGHTLPLWCPCCGGALEAESTETLSQAMMGLWLVGAVVAPLDDDPKTEAIWLAFGRNRGENPNGPNTQELPLHLNSVAQIYCPRTN